MFLELRVRIVSASLQKHPNTPEPMSTVAILKVRNVKYRTQVAINRGLSPSWNEDFIINISGATYIKVIIKEVKEGTERLIGKAKVQLSQVSHLPETRLSFPLHYKIFKRHVGEVLLDFEWRPHNEKVALQAGVTDKVFEKIDRIP